MIEEEEACWLWPDKKQLLVKVKEGVVLYQKGIYELNSLSAMDGHDRPLKN